MDQPVRLMAHESFPFLGCLAVKLRVNDGMAHGVLAILIDPRVQGREIIVEDLLVGQGLTVSSHGFGPPTEEGISGIQGCHQIQATTKKILTTVCSSSGTGSGWSVVLLVGRLRLGPRRRGMGWMKHLWSSTSTMALQL